MSISRLQQPLDVATNEASFVNLHYLSTSQVLIILFGIAIFAAFCLCLCRLRFSIERSVEPNERAQLKRNWVERLSHVLSTSVGKTILKIRQETGLDITTKSLLPLPSRNRSEGSKGSIITESIIGGEEGQETDSP